MKLEVLKNSNWWSGSKVVELKSGVVVESSVLGKFFEDALDAGIVKIQVKEMKQEVASKEMKLTLQTKDKPRKAGRPRKEAKD